MKCSIENTGSEVDDASVHLLRNGGVSGLSDKPNALRTGQNGGYQALGIAIAAGAARIVLLGYDMKYAGEKANWHEPHPVRVPETWYKNHFAGHFKNLVGCGAEIINASADTALTCFPRMTIAEALR